MARLDERVAWAETVLMSAAYIPRRSVKTRQRFEAVVAERSVRGSPVTGADDTVPPIHAAQRNHVMDSDNRYC